MKSKVMFALVLLLGFEARAQSKAYTNLVVSYPQTNSIEVKTGQLARVVAFGGGGEFIVSIGTNVIDCGNFWNFVTYPRSVAVAGPATFTISQPGSGSSFCAVELINPTEPLQPSNAVVIPADSGGPVNIILESSTDLITWTAALPGSYGTSTQKRFFRVRAERAR